ncbi:MAG: hypothetical protein WC366_02250 [Bacilli bacterium]|jgi:uncharacterized protein involved in cysteine biosynthesis
MKKDRLLQTFVFIISILLFLWALYCGFYYIIQYIEHSISLSSFAEVMDTIVDWIIIAAEIVASIIGIIQYFKIADSLIDEIVTMSIILIISFCISLVLSIVSGEFNSGRSISEIVESIMGFSLQASYFASSLLLNRFVQ